MNVLNENINYSMKLRYFTKTKPSLTSNPAFKAPDVLQ